MLSLGSLPLRSLLFHWRGNVAVLLAAALSAAILTGALFVGDSLRGSLRTRAERQLNGISASWTGSRLIRTETVGSGVPALMLQGSLTNEGSTEIATVPRVVFIGLTSEGFKQFQLKEPTGSGIPAILSQRVAEKIATKSGEKLRLSVQQLTNVPRSSILNKRSADATSAAATLTVAEILAEEHAANDFSLLPNPAGVLNVFVPLKALQDAVLVTVEDRRSLPRELVADKTNRVNALFSFGNDANAIEAELAKTLDLPDWGLKLRTQRDARSGTLVTSRELPYISVESDRLLLEPAVVDAVETAAKKLNLRSTRTTVYLANDIALGDKAIPYSLVAAVEANAATPLGPFLPQGASELRDDEILLADWPDSPIRHAKDGDSVTLRFFAPDVESGERTLTADFVLKGKLPLAGVAADPNLTPPFPGITDRLSISQWNPPFTMDKSRIKPNDANERFWQNYRTTPKAYITRAAGEKLFSSRFGNVTSIRIAPHETPEATATRLRPELRGLLTPKAGGIVVESTRERLLLASKGGTDFGGLFLGFSFFLIVSALLLVALMFRLNIERRAKEIGGLLAAGFPPRIVLRLLLREAMILAILGTLIGILAAVFYSRFLLQIITILWPDPTVKSFLQPHTTWLSATLGFILTLAMTAVAIWLAVRKLVRIAPPSLLRGQTETAETEARPKTRRTWILYVCIIGAIASLVGGSFLANPDFRALSFFAGGSLLFVAGLLLIRRWLASSRTSLPSLNSLSFRNAGRSPGRSLLTVFLIGSATFLLVAVESFRRKPERDFADKTGGSGGFNLLVESDVPLFNRFDTKPGRDDILLGYEEQIQWQGGDKATMLKEAEANLNAIAASIPLRLVSGDDASCLNLYQAGRPRLLGVPDAMVERGGFRFMMTEASTAEEKANPWLLLRKTLPDGAIPVFAEQNTAMWMLKTMVGGTLEILDENGKLVKCRLVGTLQDSVFQSELILADEQLRKLHPREEGFRIHLVETPNEAAVAKLLATGLSGNGVSVSSARERVAAYQSVVGTYLSTFQLLGALGLLLGLFGLAIVILRGVWERLGELALLRAFGYTPTVLRKLILHENLLLLALGVALGLIAAVVSVLPHLALGGSLLWLSVGILLVGVLVVGTLVVMFTTANATRVPILSVLRKE